MELQTITVKKRTETGKGPARQTRMTGNLPGVLYGKGQDAVGLTINAKDLDHVLHGEQGEHAILEISVEDNPDLNGPAVLKEIQHHPVRGHVMHADFMRINMNEKLHTLVPIKLVGRSVGIIEGGVLDHQLRELEIECLPLDVPDHIEGDITELAIGDSLHVSDLAIDEKITVLTDPARTIGAIHAPRVVKTAAEEVAEAEEAAAEGEETPAEGEEETSE